MSSPRSTADTIARDVPALPEDCLAVRLSEGAWRPDRDTAIAVWQDGVLIGLYYQSDLPRAAAALPPGAVGFAVNLRPLTIPFGVAGIGTAVVRRDPRVEARVGMNGAVTLRFCHAAGLWRLLRAGGAERLSCGETLAEARGELARALAGSLTALFGPEPWDAGSIDAALASGALRESAARGVFRALYGFGLLAAPSGVSVAGVAYSPADGC